MSAETRVLSRLTVACLLYLADHPGACATALRDGLGMRHLSQASRLLYRLERQGLVRGGQPNARRRAWSLTPEGLHVLTEQRPIWTADAAAAPTSPPARLVPRAA